MKIAILLGSSSTDSIEAISRQKQFLINKYIKSNQNVLAKGFTLASFGDLVTEFKFMNISQYEIDDEKTHLLTSPA